uniref:CCHC-type domain-containing protein n=1 Tax=Trichogramma kaykai TaxID=54128 RepID=A0ABD2WDI1_9HYME
MHSWQDFERRFRRSFASQATPEELLTELQRRTQGKGEDINTYLTNFRYLCSRFREPLPYENQVAIAFRGIRPEYRNFMAHREINSFSALEKAGKEYEKLCRINAYWHEPVTHANQLHPSAAYKPVQAKQCAAVEVSSPKAEDGASKKSKKKTSPKKKATPPPSSPPKEVAALEKTQLSQSGRHGGRRTQWKNSNLHPSGGAIRKELSCNNCKRQGHWTTNCPTIECFRCHKKGHMARACPEAEENTGKSDVACQGCGQRGVTATNCDRCGYLFDRSGNEQGEAQGRSPRL